MALCLTDRLIRSKKLTDDKAVSSRLSDSCEDGEVSYVSTARSLAAGKLIHTKTHRALPHHLRRLVF